MKQEMTGTLQENILTVLCFDDVAGKLIRSNITPELFENAVMRDIASHAIDFMDVYGVAIKEHIADSLEVVLNADPRKAKLYKVTLENLYYAKDTINVEYVLGQLNKFVRQQNIKSGIVGAVADLDNDDIDAAEVRLTNALKAQITNFESGITFGDANQSLKFFDEQDEHIHIGIKPLDDRGLGPAAGEMMLFIAPAKKGKTWALIHVGKHCILQRKRVVHISLEMSQDRTAQRYVQSFFAISKREAKVRVAKLRMDKDGDLLGIESEVLERPTLQDPNARAHAAASINKTMKNRPTLKIKHFATGTLTMSMLEAYLDGLERYEKFIPDVIIIDYPDLMKVDGNNLRTSLGEVFKEVRGLGVKRHAAMVVVTQGNRESADAKLVTDTMVGEDYSKIATADLVITYSQTKQEKSSGLARLFVSNSRNDEDKFEVLITQAYGMGQFALDAAYMQSNYWQVLEGTPEDPDD